MEPKYHIRVKSSRSYLPALGKKKNNTKFLPLATLRQYTCLSILNEIPFYVYTYMYMYGLGNLRLIFLEYLGCCRKHSSIFLLVKAVVGIQAFSANPSLKSLIV